MKAIYINLDPYLAAVAAWIKGGKSVPAPHFDPLPLAVTIPAGESACLFLPDASSGEGSAVSATIDGQTIYYTGYIESASVIASGVVPGLSRCNPTETNAVVLVTGESIVVPVYTGAESDASDGPEIYFTVLVRREQASGPVDLVDFTPPAAAPSAADIKSALVAAGSGALAGVFLNGTKYQVEGEDDPSSVFTIDSSGGITADNPALALTSPGS